MVAVYADSLPQLVETARHLLEVIEVYEHNGSGWVFSSFVSLELSLWQLDPLRAGTFIPLQRWIRDKGAVTNVVGTGDGCFKWAVLAGLHPAIDSPNHMENYLAYVDKYYFSTLSYPVPLSSIAPFAARNGISINVYAVEDGKPVVFPLCVTDNVVKGKHVDLLLHEMGGIQHYSTIRNFSRLVSAQLNIHRQAVYYCKKCLHAYSSSKLLKKHSLDCCHVQRFEFPKDPRCKFTNIKKQLLAPVVVLEPLSNVDTTQGVAVGGEPSTTPY